MRFSLIFYKTCKTRLFEDGVEEWVGLFVARLCKTKGQTMKRAPNLDSVSSVQNWTYVRERGR